MSLPLWQTLPVRWVLLDRDGVINHDSSEYVRSADQWRPIDGSIEAMARLYAAGCKLAVVTNQSGIGRNYYGRSELFAMHRKMATLLARQGAQVEAVLFCPHLADADCDCRKPAAGMLHRVMNCFGFSADQAVLVGDAERDLAAAAEVDINGVRVGDAGDYPTLAEWVDRLLGITQ
ncbi:MAG: D-glycero-beta-D-manno-heptose-1,7-bisphosphate 7-phosphatase [Gammaproteobacteria bacterium]|nr:MAG: D-glycero-beta-D-manno-heptose-1,7-bisphosphate 7-phosphatase [Gammaproteobacteria bacterium]RLA10660.1 MAG: D-glycero-beta-D-manno-heptose-1,7-bisphosphate 7-phosphatase [Gammaproteobacteria bacterium]RLA13226.1 MAG: D-glycero-beta-D-manno-heptose-1,7-bisphosphate 7-phosphatase [Gammaproteobacteria bacterium]